MVLMLLAGIAFAFFSPRIRRARDQGAAVRALSEADLPITITYDYQQVGTDGTVAAEASGPVWVRNWLGEDFFHPVVSVKWGGGPASYLMTGGGRLVVRSGAIGPAPTQQQLELLSALGELRELSITAPLTDDGLVPLGSLRQLERLELSCGGMWGRGGVTSFSDAGVAHLSRLTRLKQLAIRSPPVTGATLGQLEALPHIEALSLAMSGIDNAGMEQLAAAASLTNLDLNRTTISDAGVAHLAGLDRLRALDLSYTAVGDDAMAVLNPEVQLRVLNLAGTSTTDMGLEFLHQFVSLEKIALESTHVSTTGMVRCDQALPNCRVTPLADWQDTIRHLAEQGIEGRVRLFRTLFKTEQLPALTDMSEVRDLCIDRIRIDSAALTALGTLPNLELLVVWHAPLLEQLEMLNPPQAIDDLAALAACERLTGIAFSSDCTPVAVASLARVPQLERLVYAPTAEDDLSREHVQAALDELAGLTQLEHIWLGGPMIEAGDIDALAAAVPTVRVERLPVEVNIRDIRSVLAGGD